MTDMTGLNAGQLAPSSSADFIKALNDLVRPAAWPWILAATVLLLPFSSAHPLLQIAVLVMGMALTVILGVLRSRHTVDLNYEVDGALARWHSEVRRHWPEMAEVGSIWRVAERGATQAGYQQKVNAGASHVVGRDRATARSTPHKRVKSNVILPTISSGKHSISFLPDCILLRSGGTWSDIAYGDLLISFRNQRFIEDGSVPRDGRQVGTTWRYVNKSGGPDRRFKDNRQLPVMLYGEVELTSPTGLRWLLQVSRPEAAAVMTATLEAHPSLRGASR